eukprot:TRINITY_DN28098_c0_g1_i1.p1 TRINITY_DN28098_c0_g1~~TRINITY_DN28098_c0_g1_i1.p1  ORF type:complete len:118 (-),score=14.66 TRINITY_DN28098_c0_g1_i1:223-576(-)
MGGCSGRLLPPSTNVARVPMGVEDTLAVPSNIEKIPKLELRSNSMESTIASMSDSQVRRHMRTKSKRQRRQKLVATYEKKCFERFIGLHDAFLSNVKSEANLADVTEKSSSTTKLQL